LRLKILLLLWIGVANTIRGEERRGEERRAFTISHDFVSILFSGSLFFAAWYVSNTTDDNRWIYGVL
jgi:hypothetical protein